MDWVSSLTKGKDAIQESTLKLGAFNEALQSSDYSNAIEQVSQLKINIDLAKKGFLDKKEVLEQYNSTLGKAMGTTNDINKAEEILVNKGDAYIKMTLLKAESQIALQNAAQKAIEAEQEKVKPDSEVLTFWDKTVDVLKRAANYASGDMELIDADGDLIKKVKERRDETIDDLNNQKDTYTKIARDFEIQAEKISKALNPTSTNNNNTGGNTSTAQQKIEQQKKALQDAETMYNESLKRRLQVTNEAYGNETAAENNHYQDQLARLKKSLDDKLIKKEEYAKVSQQLEAEHNTNIAAINDKYNQQDAERAMQTQNELANLQIKGMKDGFAKQIAELTQQQTEREEQYDKADNESAARIEKLGNEMAAAKKNNPNADTSELQKMINTEWAVINTNNQKRIEDEKQTDEQIAKLKKQAYLQPDEDAVNKAADPKARYDAQKKLLMDTATFEVQQAKGNASQIIAINTELIANLAKLDTDYKTQQDAIRKQRQKQIIDEAKKAAQQIGADGLNMLQQSIVQQADAKVAALEKDKAAELNNTALTSTQKAAITQKYQQEEKQIKAKAFKEEQELSIAQAIMNGALAVTKVTAQDGVLAALEIGVIVAETAAQVAKIASQKPPAYASGGLHYKSDGRGGMLPGYSRTDNTNAFLRSGEGIVVSEAMREPWARNLVSAINVGFGGRDFSTTTTGKGFAVGGIFTDGGNANRYYNQPVNDNKNLANTLAYQMINNFPPVYVDVKDINNQQNILAQTINRVNL